MTKTQVISGGWIVLDENKFKSVAILYCPGRQRFYSLSVEKFLPTFPQKMLDMVVKSVTLCVVCTCICYMNHGEKKKLVHYPTPEIIV